MNNIKFTLVIIQYSSWQCMCNSMSCHTLADQASVVDHICPGSLQVSAVSSCFEILSLAFCCPCIKIHSLWTSVLWDVAWCGLVFGHGATSQKSEDLNYITTSLKSHIVHCCFLPYYLKSTLKSCLQETCHIDKDATLS